MASLGYEGYQVSGWSAIFAPKKTPADVIHKLNGAISNYLNSAAGKRYVAERAGYADPLTPEQTAQWVRSEMENYKRTFQQAGIEPE